MLLTRKSQSRPLQDRRLHDRLLVGDCRQAVQEAAASLRRTRPVLTFGAAGRGGRTVMEYFGSAVMELLDCSCCLVAKMPCAGSIAVEQVRIGKPKSDAASDDAITHIATRLRSENAILSSAESGNALATLARDALGRQSARSAHSVMGRVATADDMEVIFVAGWREMALLPEDSAWLSRAVRVIWDTASRFMAPRSERPDLQSFIEELVFPAFIVGTNLALHEINDSGRKLLVKGELLRAEAGLLTGLNATVTDCIRQAVQNALAPRSDHRWENSTVILSAEHQQYAFAWVGAVPVSPDMNQVLVIVPRVNESAGAHRIAVAFGLSYAEERIISRILHGQGPRDIGAGLGLTEATVRTYTKRIMLKLGINRQSELFLLYILTLSPFGAGRPERAVSCALPYSRMSEGAYWSQDN